MRHRALTVTSEREGVTFPGCSCHRMHTRGFQIRRTSNSFNCQVRGRRLDAVEDVPRGTCLESRNQRPRQDVPRGTHGQPSARALLQWGLVPQGGAPAARPPRLRVSLAERPTRAEGSKFHVEHEATETPPVVVVARALAAALVTMPRRRGGRGLILELRPFPKAMFHVERRARACITHHVPRGTSLEGRRRHRLQDVPRGT